MCLPQWMESGLHLHPHPQGPLRSLHSLRSLSTLSNSPALRFLLLRYTIILNGSFFVKTAFKTIWRYVNKSLCQYCNFFNSVSSFFFLFSFPYRFWKKKLARQTRRQSRTLKETHPQISIKVIMYSSMVFKNVY